MHNAVRRCLEVVVGCSLDASNPRHQARSDITYIQTLPTALLVRDAAHQTHRKESKAIVEIKGLQVKQTMWLSWSFGSLYRRTSGLQLRFVRACPSLRLLIEEARKNASNQNPPTRGWLDILG